LEAASGKNYDKLFEGNSDQTPTEKVIPDLKGRELEKWRNVAANGIGFSNPPPGDAGTCPQFSSFSCLAWRRLDL
jgi:hypothetical protein